MKYNLKWCRKMILASNSNPIYNLKRSKLFDENSENSNLQDDLKLGEEFGNFTAKSRKMGPKCGVSKRCTKRRKTEGTCKMGGFI